MKSGSRILILGGSGAVGQMAIQLAKSRGAWVATTCSTRSVPFVSQFAPDRIIDYAKVSSLAVCCCITVAFICLARALNCFALWHQPVFCPTREMQENWWELQDLNVDAVFDTVGCDGLVAKAKVNRRAAIHSGVVGLTCAFSGHPSSGWCPRLHCHV